MFTFVGTSISLPLFLLELGFENRRVDGLERTLRAHPTWMQYETVDLFQMIETAPDYGITHARRLGGVRVWPTPAFGGAGQKAKG